MRVLGTTEYGNLILERGQVPRTSVQELGIDPITFDRKLRWLRYAAEGLRHVHSNDIVYADVGCNNMIITADDCLKAIDFEGCSIDDKPADSFYEWFSYRPSTLKISRQIDIFAYGCIVHEIMSGKPPYNEYRSSDDRSRLVEQLYKYKNFLT